MGFKGTIWRLNDHLNNLILLKSDKAYITVVIKYELHSTIAIQLNTES